MPGFKRVRDVQTGHEYSTAAYIPAVHILLDEPAEDADGRALPAKPTSTPGPIEELSDADHEAAETAKATAAEAAEAEAAKTASKKGTAQGGSTGSDTTGGN